MGPQFRVRFSAWVLVALALVAAGPARAQFYADARHDLDLSPDPAERSPRTLGMGRLSYVIDDVHLRADLWEFSRNPAGLLDTDSSSTLEIYPGTSAASRVHDDLNSAASREQQEFALREVRLGYEGWHRAGGQTAFGFIGDFGHLRTDAPQSGTSERREQFSVPNTMIAISGKVPRVLPDRLRYGLALQHLYQSDESAYHLIVSNPAGDYIDKDGATVPAPDLLTPLSFTIRSVGFRLGLSYRVDTWLTLAGAGDFTSNSIAGKNDGDRDYSEVTEDRSYRTGSLSAIGHVATPGSGTAEYALDYLQWGTGTTDEKWFVTLSRGTGQTPIQGRGAYATREEDGKQLRTRLQWTGGPVTVGFGATRLTRDVDLFPPVPGGDSFNAFLRMLASRPEVDSLALPDSVRKNQTEETSTDLGGGVAVRLPWRQVLVGVEYRQVDDTFEQTRSAHGPEPRTREWRLGAEAPAGAALTLRAGYNDRWYDFDRLTSGSEYVFRMATAGFALHQPRAVWTLEGSYGMGWGQSDFGDPTRIRSSRHQAVGRLRWAF